MNKIQKSTGCLILNYFLDYLVPVEYHVGWLFLCVNFI